MKDCVCTTCHTTGRPRRLVKGSVLVELLMWLLFLLPGLIYTTWRSASAKLVCRACGSSAILPLDSPEGKRIYLASLNKS